MELGDKMSWEYYVMGIMALLTWSVWGAIMNLPMTLAKGIWFVCCIISAAVILIKLMCIEDVRA